MISVATRLNIQQVIAHITSRRKISIEVLYAKKRHIIQPAVYLMQKTTSRYIKQKLSNPTKDDRLTIEVTTTQEEVTAVRGDFMVGAVTIKTETIHPEVQNFGVAITMAILV
jgi:hypothetical protein